MYLTSGTVYICSLSHNSFPSTSMIPLSTGMAALIMMSRFRRAISAVGFWRVIAVFVPLAFFFTFIIRTCAGACCWNSALLPSDAISSSRSDDGRVGAAAVCKHGNQWRSRRSFLGTGRMEVFDAELWAIGLALGETIEKRETLQRHGVKTVAIFSDSQTAIRRAAHLEPGPGQRLARRINRRARALLAHGIATEIHWVPGHSGIPGNEEADCQANLARDASGDTVIERPYTSASNRARRISEGRSAAKAKWEADKCSKHFSYRLKGKTGTKRPVPMTSVKSLATRFYRLKCGHAPTGVYLKRFGHREDDKCWWCGGGGRTAQTREHLFRHCSRWRDQQQALWKAVGKATGWKAGRCRHVQISELFSVEECDQAVMDFLAATEVGKFPPR